MVRRLADRSQWEFWADVCGIVDLVFPLDDAVNEARTGNLRHSHDSPEEHVGLRAVN